MAGCLDTNDNAADFGELAPAPRNSAAAPAYCNCPTAANNETDAPAEADFCNLQSPTTLNVAQGQATAQIYGRIYEATITEGAGASPIVLAQVGYGLLGSDPTVQMSFAFVDASYNQQYGNDDEYMGSFLAPPVAAGKDYAYTFRFSLDGGSSWTYCDTNGAGSNTGLTFEPAQLGTATVTP